MLNDRDLAEQIRNTTEAIRRFFAVDGDLSEDEVEALHRPLVNCVQAVNSWLRHCDELLRSGLRIEAIHENERTPGVVLTDLVTQLDMPEWDAWSSYVRRFGIPPMPPLLREIAAELNSAYTQALDLHATMRVHRALAIGRAPLRDRLGVLRLIASQDPENHIWAKDVESYEAERLRCIEKEVIDAEAQRDLTLASELRAEVEQAQWRITPSPSVVDVVVSTHQRLVQSDARERLYKLADQLDLAFADFDTKTGNLLHSEWSELAEVACLGDADPLAVRVQPAFQWLQQEAKASEEAAQRRVAVDTLARALEDESVDLATLNRLVTQAERLDVEIPDWIARSYEQRKKSQEDSTRRRSYYVIAITLSAIALVATGTGVVIWWRLEESRTLRVVQTLHEYVEREDFQVGLSVYDSLLQSSPKLASDDRVQSEVQELRELQSKAAVRVNVLTALLEDAVRIATSEPGWPDVNEARGILTEAEPKALTEEDQLRFRDAKRQVDAAYSRVQGAIEEKFLADIDRLAEGVRSITDGRPTVAEIDGLIDLAKDLESRTGVSAQTKRIAALPIQLKALSDRRKSLLQEERDDALMQSVVNSIGSPAGYKKALESFAAAHPNSLRTSHFIRVVVRDVPLLSSIERRNAWLQRWATKRGKPFVLHPESALPLLREADAELLQFPEISRVAQLRPYAEAGLKREEALKSVLEEFTRDIYKTFSARDRSGNLVYYSQAPRTRNSSLGPVMQVALIVNDNCDTEKDGNLKSLTTALPAGPSGPSPMQQLAKKAKQLLTKPSMVYEEQAFQLLMLVIDDTRLDEIFAVELAQFLISELRRGSSLLDEELQEAAALLDSFQGFDKVNWLENQKRRPDQAALADQAKIRSELQTALKSMRTGGGASLSSSRTRTRNRLKEIVSEPAPTILTWQSILLRAGSTSQSWLISRETSPLHPPGRGSARVNNTPLDPALYIVDQGGGGTVQASAIDEVADRLFKRDELKVRGTNRVSAWSAEVSIAPENAYEGRPVFRQVPFAEPPSLHE